jgi:hypothetical protein
MEKTIILKIFVREGDSYQEYIVPINEKICDIKKKILEKTFNINEHDKFTIEFNNITDRIYKDYGKLYFDIGVIPNSLDNYKFEQFTNENRIFSFLCKVDKRVISVRNDEANPEKRPRYNYIKNEKNEKNEKNDEFVFNEKDFPAL